MLLKIVQVGHPVLREKARDLTRDELKSGELQALIELMRATMYDAPGVGLAAPQIGQPLRLAVIEDREVSMAGLSDEERRARAREVIPFHVIANPVLTVEDAAPIEFYEGCLSLNGFAASVARSSGVRVDALDHHGDPITIHARGWYARILQHEIDHLNGMIYIDRMDSRTFTSSDNHLRYGPMRSK